MEPTPRTRARRPRASRPTGELPSELTPGPAARAFDRSWRISTIYALGGFGPLGSNGLIEAGQIALGLLLIVMSAIAAVLVGVTIRD